MALPRYAPCLFAVAVSAGAAAQDAAPFKLTILHTNDTHAHHEPQSRSGDGYTQFAEQAIDPYDYGRPLEEALIDYMISHNPVALELEGRISAQQ